ncbi:MAG: nicotinate-nucleotide adenylyltransferase [Firmicutes bacterium]|nr:nicotinate-nucleotide adenylyltransferase [Bacillota bacterium]
MTEIAAAAPSVLPLSPRDGAAVKRLGIMGGTFDPIHYGHLVTAEAARTHFRLDQVVFVPSGRPPHKKSGTSEANDRLVMTELAIVTNPGFDLSDTEIRREGYSYSIDTVREFISVYGPDTEIFFITGADAILEIATWKNADDLVRLCTFIAATRPGFDLAELEKLPAAWQERIRLFEIPALAISSTDIRRRVREGDSIKYLLPEPVEHYIRRRGLYRKESR